MDHEWSIEQALATYNTLYWGDGYFGVNEKGHLEVCVPSTERNDLLKGDLTVLLEKLLAAGLRPPILVRFTDILKDRVRRLNNAFSETSKKLNYQGGYTAVYPIKVNQQRRVIEEILQPHGDQKIQVGLECGSKPELLAVLALAPQNSLVICNGYKDREYIRLALSGLKMGLAMRVVVEKASELELLLDEAESLSVTPQLGVRVRLSTTGKGQWQNTGGSKSKFGLSAPQLLGLVSELSKNGKLNWLRMLHFHMGSQVSDGEDIQQCMSEAVRFFVELRGLGAPITELDVGGGLGVDYEGTCSSSYFSMNYSVEDYAYNILSPIKDACEQHGLPNPDIITESGRALTAHHAILITDVVDRERPGDASSMLSVQCQTEPQEVLSLKQRIQAPMTDREMVELYQHIKLARHQAEGKFHHGELDLEKWANMEQCFLSMFRELRVKLNRSVRAHQLIFDELNDLLADKLFVNFSLFQSLPDAWGIGQIFPIMPLKGMLERPVDRVVIHDMTCDSDGRINHYVDGMGIETTLPMPPSPDGDQTEYVAFFMVGAYQEILGDMHNLFGDTDSVDVVLEEQDFYILSDAKQGDTVDSVLKYVDFDPNDLFKKLQGKLQQSDLTTQERVELIADLSEGLRGYTYFEN